VVHKNVQAITYMRDDVINEPSNTVNDRSINNGAGQHYLADQVFGRFTWRVCWHFWNFCDQVKHGLVVQWSRGYASILSFRSKSNYSGVMTIIYMVTQSKEKRQKLKVKKSNYRLLQHWDDGRKKSHNENQRFVCRNISCFWTKIIYFQFHCEIFKRQRQ